MLFQVGVGAQTHFTCRHRPSVSCFAAKTSVPQKRIVLPSVLHYLHHPPAARLISRGWVFTTIFICKPRPRKSCADIAGEIVAAVHNKR